MESGPTMKKQVAPLWSYALLVVAVLCMSTGGIWFALLDDTPPLMQATWRSLLTSLLQLIGFLYELRTDTSLDAAFWRRVRRSWGVLLLVGICLGVFFGSLAWSVAHTSLVDSLFLATTTPLLIVLVMFFRWLIQRRSSSLPHADALLSPHSTPDPIPDPASPTSIRAVLFPRNALPPTLLEAIGTVLGFLGVVVLLTTSSASHATTGHPSSVAGNAIAFFGAAVMVPFLEGSALCRQWMPLCAFSLPTTALSTFIVAVASLALEPSTSVAGLGPAALFGFLGDGRRFGLAFGSAAVAGIAGNTLMNLVVKDHSPLLVSIGVLWEPLLGGVIGWLVHVQGAPDTTTLAAAPFLFGGSLLVVLGAREYGIDPRRWCRAKVPSPPSAQE
ncbi:Aste57867_22965 [Aphanomyces stellatus]|uniref:Aste57867_22965 protein n=1 Tax=Aphanomyces stellatus TaxID=120398 RepID=A0A485LMH9_9STRA|nr:hypothetical protein As57867_022894 [Aphanomyces stellatus]VFT99615.1 Aste57867_22965 [Aphanomyces stellatus]